MSERRHIRVLLVEDDPAAAELLLHELRRAGFEPDAKRVETEAAFVEHLRDHVDVIFLDYAIPEFGGLRALQLVRERQPDIPCIVVTGAVDDLAVSECMQHGAADYLLKDRLARLGLAVHRVLEIKRQRAERRTIETELRESERRQATLLSNLPGMAYRCRNDPDWTMEFVSDGAVALTGYRPEDLVDNRTISFAKVIHPDDRQRVWNEVQAALRDRRRFQIEYRIRTADGSERWVWEHGCGIFDAQGNVLTLEGFITDVTERTRVKHALRESRQRLEAILANAPAVIYAKDADGRYTLVNRRFEELFHVTEPDVLGKTDHDIFPSRVADAFRENDAKVVAAGEALHFEEVAPQDDGDHHYLSVKFPLCDAAGHLYAVCGISTDISRRKRAEELVHLAVDALPNATLMIDAEGRIVYVNKEAERLFGFAAPEVIGQPLEVLVPPRVRARHVALRERFMREPQPRHMNERADLVACRKDGSEVPVEIGLTPLRTGSGLLILAVIVDLTARQQAEAMLKEHIARIEQLNADLSRSKQALEGAVAELERSNRELDDFAYIASHDLKEPLRGIHNYARFLLEDYGDRIDDDGKSKLETLTRLTRRLDALIDALLEYSRVGRTELAVQETDLDRVLAEVLETLEVTVKEEPVDVRVPRSLPTIRCDRVRIAEVFRNLITNAMKYNDKPERWIEIGYETQRDVGEPRSAKGHEGTAAPGDVPEDGRGEYAFYVRDNGVGIAEKHLTSIFRIFKRLHARDRFGGGAGVGLTIVKRIVERHGGRVWAESQPNEGTTFYFTLNGETHNVEAGGGHETADSDCRGQPGGLRDDVAIVSQVRGAQPGLSL